MNYQSARLVAEREIRERGRSTSLRVGTIISLLVVAAAVAIPALRQSHRPTFKVGVVGPISAAARADLIDAGTTVGANVQLSVQPSEADAREALKAKHLDVAYISGERLVVAKGYSASSTSKLALYVQEAASSLSVQAAVERAGIPPDQAAAVTHPPPLPVVALKPVPKNGTQRITTFYGILLLYVLIQQYGYWLLLGVVEEKSTRVVEVLLSTVEPQELLVGKSVGIGLLALTQGVLLVVTALLVGAATGSDLLKGSAPAAVGAALMWFVLGYIFYCSLFAAGGSLASRTEDAQNIAFPLQLPLLIAYFLSFPVLFSGNASTLITILAYLPPTAPLAMPALAAVGKASALDVAISAVITLIGAVLLMRVAAKVYNRALLRTGRRLKVREVLASSNA